MYYVAFKRDGKLIEAKVGGQYRNDMTPARAAGVRADLIAGKQLTRKEQREQARQAALEEQTRPTMTKLWEAFRAAKQGNRSLRDDISRWKNHLEPVFAGKTPDEILTLDVDRLRLRLTKNGMAPATVKQVLVLMKRIINHSIKRGLCPAIDPSRLHFEMPKINNETTEDLSPEQLARLLKAIDSAADWRAAGLLRLAMFTGMRRGELLGLKWDDIDLRQGFIRIVNPKGGKDASIPLNRQAQLTLMGLPRAGSEYVFPGRGGGKSSDLKNPVAAIKKAAGLPPDFRPCHGLRHFFASTLASSGKVDLHTLQRLLTHKSPQMTQRYAHLRDEALKTASSVMDDVFRKQG
ncbi:MAG: site-specific integrase [Thermodesulfobacteriota bacterium]